jgi:hypothetical protein
MFRERTRFSTPRGLLVCLLAGLALTSSCVRKSNPGDEGGCTSSSECPTGNECQQGGCVPVASGGASNGGSVGDGGTVGTSGGATSTGGSDSSGGLGGNASGGSAAGGSNSGGDSNGGSDSAGGSTSGGNGGGSVSADMIDDLEDNDARILMNGGRQGPWHIFNSADGGTQTPASNAELKPESGGANGSQRAMHTRGSGYTFAGFGFDLDNADALPESMQSRAYDASAFTGISFMVKLGSSGGAQLRLEVPSKEFVPVSRGGSCPENGTCWNVYGSRLKETLTTSWQEIRVSFASMLREQDGTTPPLNVSQLMSISFKHEGSGAFDFWIDDIRFYK